MPPLLPPKLCRRGTWWLLISSSLLSLLLRPCSGFKWTIDEALDSMQILTLSERYMFASGEGPILLPQGDSYIDAKATVEFTMNLNESSTIKYVIYATDFEHHDSSVGLCGESITNYPWAQNAFIFSVPSSYVRTVRNPDSNGLNFIYQARVHKRYVVRTEAWHNVAFQICGGESELLQATISGTVSFRNPYGFIPAELYGIFPFEAARSLAFICLAIYYLYLFRAYELSILLLHKAVFAVLFVALAEAVVWFAAYQKLNLTGTPYCCPFPPLVAGALIMQILRQALSRCLLLVVSLGYGIVRPKLLWMEWIAVSIITILYFSIATAFEVSNIVSLDVHPNSAPNSNGMMFPSMVIDILFLSWIYLALTSTIRILTEFQQSHKLAMYQKLYSTIAVFSVLFILVSFLMSLKSSGTLSFPWQWEWMQQVSWEILNFSALAAVCMICSPSDNSILLSYVSQLPTEDPDDDEDGVELGGAPSAQDSDDSDDPKPVTTQPGSPSKSLKPTSPPSSPSSQMYSLPTADDEDDAYAI